MSPLAARGRWVRFSKYEITEDSLMIRPADGAELEDYDPWQEYLDALEDERLTPYADLLDIANDIRTDGRGATVDGNNLRRILGWCSENGLLGSLHRDTSYVRLAATEKQNDLDGEPYLSHTTYWHEGGSWTSGTIDVEKESLEPTVMVRASPGVKEVSLSKGWGMYFWSVPEEKKQTYQYPFPETKAFWRQYSEPLAMFVAQIKHLEEAVKTLALVRGDRRVFEELGFGTRPTNDEAHSLLPDSFPTLELDFSHYDSSDESAGSVETKKYEFVLSAMDSFNGLLDGTKVLLSATGNGEYKSQLNTPSLLSTLAASCMEDLLFGTTRLVRCASGSCGNIVFTKKPNQTFCSERCRKREEMRRYRAKKKKSS